MARIIYSTLGRRMLVLFNTFYHQDRIHEVVDKENYMTRARFYLEVLIERKKMN